MATPEKRRRMVKNFLDRHGRDGLERLIRMLQEGASGQAIADEYSVSRERVRQWKNAFGEVIMIYQVHAEVRESLLP